MKQESCFSCQQQDCPDSCCGVFEGFSDRLISVEGRDFSEIILTDDDVSALLNSEYKELLFQGSDGLFRIATAEDGTCLALRSGKCIINQFKPTICKCFPLYLDLFIGLCANRECRATGEHSSLQFYKNELPHFLQMCEFWINYYKKLVAKAEEHKI